MVTKEKEALMNNKKEKERGENSLINGTNNRTGKKDAWDWYK